MQLFLVLVGLSAVLVAHSPGFFHEFVLWDDTTYVTNNEHVLGGLTMDNVFWAFTQFHAANYHPLTWVSLQLDASVWGPEPFGFHTTNILLHLGNTFLVFLLFKRMGCNLFVSYFVMLLFGLHPVHVESVAWVTERKDQLFMLFGLLALISYVDVVRQSEGANKLKASSLLRPAGWLLCSLLSKPMLVTFPLLAICLDVWPLGRLGVPKSSTEPFKGFSHESFTTIWRLILEKWPLWLLVIIFSVSTVLAQSLGGAVASLTTVSLRARLANALVSIFRYLGKLFWPTDFSFFYRPLSFDDHDLRLIAAGLGLVCLSFAAIRLIRVRPYLAVGWAWFLLSLLPVIGIIQVGNQSMADRYLYLPAIGIYVVFAVAMQEVINLIFRSSKQRSQAKVALVATTGVLLACLTHQQSLVWRESRTLFAHGLEVDSNNDLALANLGVIAIQEQDFEAAFDYYHRAISLNPCLPPEVFKHRGVARFQLGDLSGAIDDMKLAIELQPDNARWLELRGVFLARADRVNEALLMYQAAMQLEPGNARLAFNFAVAHERAGNKAEAIAYYRQAYQLDPSMQDARDLADALQVEAMPSLNQEASSPNSK